MNDYHKDMETAIQFFSDQIRYIRAGGITDAVIDSLVVDASQGSIKLSFIANSIMQGQRILVTPHDPYETSYITSSLKDHGFDAYLASKNVIAIAIPRFSGDERKKVQKLISKMGEEAKIAVRNIRKSAKNKIENDKSEEKTLQRHTDNAIKEIDNIISRKFKEL